MPDARSISGVKPQSIIPPVTIQRETRHPRQLRWSAKNAKLLGQIPDARLARKLGISLVSVQLERRRRGIEPFRPRRPDIQWTRQMIQLLGTDIDDRIAERLGLSMPSVRHKRQRMGIPAYGNPPEQRHPEVFNWTKSKIALLGKDSDRKIAERLGTTLGVVALQRTRLGIPSFYRQRRIVWTREMTALLGKITDWKIAEKYGIDRESVARARLRHGIKPCVETRPVKTTPNLKRILRLPLRVISRHLNISTETVARLRRKLGVSPPPRWPAGPRG